MDNNQYINNSYLESQNTNPLSNSKDPDITIPVEQSEVQVNEPSQSIQFTSREKSRSRFGKKWIIILLLVILIGGLFYKFYLSPEIVNKYQADNPIEELEMYLKDVFITATDSIEFEGSSLINREGLESISKLSDKLYYLDFSDPKRVSFTLEFLPNDSDQNLLLASGFINKNEGIDEFFKSVESYPQSTTEQYSIGLTFYGLTDQNTSTLLDFDIQYIHPFVYARLDGRKETLDYIRDTDNPLSVLALVGSENYYKINLEEEDSDTILGNANPENSQILSYLLTESNEAEIDKLNELKQRLMLEIEGIELITNVSKLDGESNCYIGRINLDSLLSKAYVEVKNLEDETFILLQTILLSLRDSFSKNIEKIGVKICSAEFQNDMNIGIELKNGDLYIMNLLLVE